MKISIARLKEIIVEEVAKAAIIEELDPVGQEDEDVDNDGDHDESDQYLQNRRDAISAAIKEELLNIDIIDDE